MSYQQIVLNTDFSPIKIYIDELLKINCSLVPHVSLKNNGNYIGFCFYGFITNKETQKPLIIISPTEKKYIYDGINIYNNNIDIKTEIKRNKIKFINDDNIIKLLEEIEIECRDIIRKNKNLNQ